MAPSTLRISVLFRWSVLAMLLLLPFLQACETDLEVNAEKEDVTILYGILDQNETRHYIKINRAFLEEGDALVMASQQGITDYDDTEISGVVEETDVSGQTKFASYPLLRETLVDKETGLFFSDSTNIYYFDKANLDPSHIYTIKLSIGSGEAKKEVSASTNLVQNFDFAGSLKFPTAAVSFATRSGYADETTFEWQPAENAYQYQLSILFTYYDILTSGDTIPHTITWRTSTVRAPNGNPTGELSSVVNGEDFYRLLAAEIPPFLETPNLVRRVPCRKVNFVIYAAAEDLSIYIDVNQPSTGIIQERPEYTNVTNGFGIFSARYSITPSKAQGDPFVGRGLDNASLDELIDSDEDWSQQYTSVLGFCNPDECVICPEEQ